MIIEIENNLEKTNKLQFERSSRKYKDTNKLESPFEDKFTLSVE